jgi:membrane-associated phospholipid phosphatase
VIGPRAGVVASRPITVAGPRIDAFDRACDELLDRLRSNRVLDRVMYSASILGDWSLIWHLIGTGRGVTSERRAGEAIRLSAVLAAESLIVNQGIKRLFGRRRPAFDGAHPHALRTPLTSSFPSGHASAAFCAAAILSDHHRGAAPAWYALAALVSVSRPYVRAHHASDVVAGALVGVALGWVARRLVPAPG